MQKKIIRISFFVLLGLMIFVNACKEIQRIYTIDTNKCTRCRTCVPACGFGAIKVDSVPYVTSPDGFEYDITVSIDPKKCVGCGECFIRCPSGAISAINE